MQVERGERRTGGGGGERRRRRVGERRRRRRKRRGVREREDRGRDRGGIETEIEGAATCRE